MQTLRTIATIDSRATVRPSHEDVAFALRMIHAIIGVSLIKQPLPTYQDRLARNLKLAITIHRPATFTVRARELPDSDGTLIPVAVVEMHSHTGALCYRSDVWIDACGFYFED